MVGQIYRFISLKYFSAVTFLNQIMFRLGSLKGNIREVKNTFQGGGVMDLKIWVGEPLPPKTIGQRIFTPPPNKGHNGPEPLLCDSKIITP